MFENTTQKLSILGAFLVCISRIRTEYGDLLHKSPYSVQMRENTDQRNSKHEHFSHMVKKVTFHITMTRVFTTS